jgi:hypothetical protein
VLAFQADEPEKHLDTSQRHSEEEKARKARELAGASMKLFLKVFQPAKSQPPASKSPQEFTTFWQRHPPLREMIAIALDHNLANGANFPANPKMLKQIVDQWRKPPPPNSKGKS